MSDFPIGLREVVPDQTVPEKCKEFIINTGTYVVTKTKGQRAKVEVSSYFLYRRQNASVPD